MTTRNILLSSEYGASARKLLAHLPLLQEAQQHRRLRPITVQLAPTEACDSDCTFCSVQNRPQKRYLPFTSILNLLEDFANLGAKALELTGGGNPLLYKDRETGQTINHAISAAANFEYRVGIITNSESLAKLDRRLFGEIAWIRISLAKLEEGKTAADYDLAGFPEEKVGFSCILHNRSPSDLLDRIHQVMDRFPRARFLRLVHDARHPEHLHPVPTLPVDDPRWFVRENVGGQSFPEPFAPSCTVGLTRPYVAAPPDGIGPYLVYACTSHVLRQRNYDRNYALCTVDQVKDAWPLMWQRWKKNGYPYEVKGNGGTGWDQTCSPYCFYADDNRLLHEVVHPPVDSAFA